jgi:putative flippase GtrA
VTGARANVEVVNGTAWRFGVVGVVNTLVGLTVVLLARQWTGWNEVQANALGYGIGLLVSFLLNRRWTFDHKGGWWPSAVRFVTVVAAAWSVNVCVVLVLIEIGLLAELAHAVGVGPYAVLTYWGSRKWVFVECEASASTPCLPTEVSETGP